MHKSKYIIRESKGDESVNKKNMPKKNRFESKLIRQIRSSISSTVDLMMPYCI